MNRSGNDYIIWRNLYSKGPRPHFSQIPFLAFAFHTFIIYVGESISLNCETRKRTTRGEQDFLRKGNWEDNKIHETRSGKTTGPEAYTQANVSVAMGLERRMVVEEKERQCLNFRTVGNILVA